MGRTIKCVICDGEVVAKNGKQRTCLSAPCQLKLRSKTRAKWCRAIPTCVWCGDPILEPRKRQYHAECREDKNRLRVLQYNRTHPPKKGPKKKRNYKGTIKCLHCGKREKKSGARQVICGDAACVRARKNELKRERRARRKRLAQEREKKLRKLQNKPQRSEFERLAQRIAM